MVLVVCRTGKRVGCIRGRVAGRDNHREGSNGSSDELFAENAGCLYKRPWFMRGHIAIVMVRLTMGRALEYTSGIRRVFMGLRRYVSGGSGGVRGRLGDTQALRGRCILYNVTEVKVLSSSVGKRMGVT